jgi:hypothetical protein
VPTPIFFVAQGAPPYRLAYGQPRAAAADFGMASVTAAFDANDPGFAPAAATLGPETAQEAVEPSLAGPVGDGSPTKKYLLWALLAGAILLKTLLAVKPLRDRKAAG